MGDAAAVEVPDQRGMEDRLRMSWHAERRMLVVSHWRGALCVATTPVDVAALPGMIRLMARALEETVPVSPVVPPPPTVQSVRRDATTLLRTRLRPYLGAIAELTARTRQHL